jgi:hypothetical protein
MATGALGNFGMVAMSVVGLATVIRARRAKGRPKADPVEDRQQAGRAEMERRMASYLAGRMKEPD